MSEADQEQTPVSGLRAAVVVGAGVLPNDYDLVIVAEGRVYAEDGSSVAVAGGYAKGADLYLAISEGVSFPAKSKALRVGHDVKQHELWGFTLVTGFVNVGPAHPAYAAANLAYQRGFTAIDIHGLTAGEKERLAPWFDALATHAVEPAQVAVSFL